jgi:clan AA aspartic protease (TIGR02281 family)
VKKHLLAAIAALALGRPALAAPALTNAQDARPAPAPVEAARAPAPEDSVSIVNMGKEALAQVTLGDVPVTMRIDTGASDMLITETVAKTLIAKGEADWTTDATYQTADGHNATTRRVTIHDVRVGWHVLHNVVAYVAPDNAYPLLPFGVLDQVGRFTIDTNANKLILG